MISEIIQMKDIDERYWDIANIIMYPVGYTPVKSY